MGHIHRWYGAHIYLFLQIHKGGLMSVIATSTDDNDKKIESFFILLESS